MRLYIGILFVVIQVWTFVVAGRVTELPDAIFASFAFGSVGFYLLGTYLGFKQGVEAAYILSGDVNIKRAYRETFGKGDRK